MVMRLSTRRQPVGLDSEQFVRIILMICSFRDDDLCAAVRIGKFCKSYNLCTVYTHNNIVLIYYNRVIPWSSRLHHYSRLNIYDYARSVYRIQCAWYIIQRAPISDNKRNSMIHGGSKCSACRINIPRTGYTIIIGPKSRGTRLYDIITMTRVCVGIWIYDNMIIELLYLYTTNLLKYRILSTASHERNGGIIVYV